MFLSHRIRVSIRLDIRGFFSKVFVIRHSVAVQFFQMTEFTTSNEIQLSNHEKDKDEERTMRSQLKNRTIDLKIQIESQTYIASASTNGSFDAASCECISTYVNVQRCMQPERRCRTIRRCTGAQSFITSKTRILINANRFVLFVRARGASTLSSISSEPCALVIEHRQKKQKMVKSKMFFIVRRGRTTITF